MKSKYFLWLSIGLFFISLILPVQYNPNLGIQEIYGPSIYLGIIHLLLGYLTFSEAIIDFICWIGNITLILVWFLIIFKKAKRLGITLSCVTFLLMLLYGVDYIFKIGIIDVIDYNLYPVGYWFWLSSSVMILFYYFYPLNNNEID